MHKNKKKLKSCLQRNISISGSILLTKMEISRFIYPPCSLAVSDRCIKKINQFICNFVWNDKQYIILKCDMLKSAEEGIPPSAVEW